MFRTRTDSIEKHGNELIKNCGSLQIALNYASFNGDLVMVKYLVGQSAVDLTDVDLTDALVCASLCGNEEFVTEYNKTYYTNIHDEHPKEYLEVIKYLTKLGAVTSIYLLELVDTCEALPEVKAYLKTQFDEIIKQLSLSQIKA